MKTRTSGFEKLATYCLLLLLAVIFVFPLYWLVVNAFEPINSLPKLFPTSFHFNNFWLAVTLIPYFTYFLNSLILAAIVVSLNVTVSAVVGFTFARLKAPFKNQLFTVVLSVMMIPAVVTQIPQYIIFYKLGLLNSFWPWVLIHLGGSSIYIFMYRQFFSAVPKEIDEAARIDGCSSFRILWNIFLPISLPAIATVAIIVFTFSWGGDIITPFMFLHEDKYPLVTALMSVGYIMPNSPQVGMSQVYYAGLLIFISPIVIIFFFCQKLLIDGVTSSAVKG
jgi:multiple sugar transport system permease protein